LRIPFYAGRELYSSREKDILKYDNRHHDFVDMERFAITQRADLVIIRISKKKRDLIPEFEHFIKIKEIAGNKRCVVFIVHREF